MKKHDLLAKFHKSDFLKDEVDTLNKIHNKYARCMYAFGSSIGFACIEVIRTLTVVVLLPVYLCTETVETLRKAYIFAQVAYYWDELKEGGDSVHQYTL